MVKVIVKEESSNTPKYTGIMIAIVTFVVLAVIILKDKPGTSSASTKVPHLRTYGDWEMVADYHAAQFYECTKELDEDITMWYLYENCSRIYNNGWVMFRDALDSKANLNSNQIESLKDYWHETRDSMSKKVAGVMEENEMRKRPNAY
ncbi:MAG: hypothetical protein ACJASM_003203 [Salibacteraceae bacterium]|jgi:hypothetical protein